MQRSRRATGPLLLAVGLLVGCSDDGSDADSDSDRPARDQAEQELAPEDEAERAAAIEVIMADLVEYPRAEFTSDDQPGCVAERIVDGLGVERLAEVGLDGEARTAPTLWQPELTVAEGDVVYAAYGECIDFEARDVEQFMTEGLSEAQARCVSTAYRTSGIPRAHGLERPHDGVPTRVEAHTHLEEFLNATKTACRDWIRP
jgi:hypothetical protein